MKKYGKDWFKSLTALEKKDFIENKVKTKAAKRIKKSLNLMKDYGQKYACKNCFHGLCNSCTDNLPNGCEYYYSTITDYQGLKMQDKRLWA